MATSKKRDPRSGLTTGRHMCGTDNALERWYRPTRGTASGVAPATATWIRIRGRRGGAGGGRPGRRFERMSRPVALAG